MHGALVVCTVHNQVHNAEKKKWQEVTPEVMAELREIAEEVGNVDIWEGCCPVCNEIASSSFEQLYAQRYASAAYKEVGYDIILPWEDIE